MHDYWIKRSLQSTLHVILRAFWKSGKTVLTPTRSRNYQSKAFQREVYMQQPKLYTLLSMYKHIHCTSIWSKSLPGVATRTLIPFLILKRNTAPHAFTCTSTFIYSVFCHWLKVLRPHYAREISKRSTFLRFNLLCTLILHENGAFRKRSSNRRNLKPRLCQRWHHDKSRDFLQDRVFFKHKPQIDCCVLSYPGVSMDRKQLVRFQIETSVFGFFRRRVGVGLIIAWTKAYVQLT